MPRKRPTGDRHAIPEGEAEADALEGGFLDYVEAAVKVRKAGIKNKGGRPSGFRGEFIAQAKKLCKLGATDLDLAEFFEVDVSTIWRWSTKYDKFRSALKSGKESADDRVERSLYQRAVGYSHDAVKIFMPANATAPVHAAYVEHVPPDTTAQIFWLKNRRRNEWRDVSRQEQTGANGGPIAHSADLSGYSDNELGRLLAAPERKLAAPKDSE